jgi:hypothetical protein
VSLIGGAASLLGKINAEIKEGLGLKWSCSIMDQNSETAVPKYLQWIDLKGIIISNRIKCEFHGSRRTGRSTINNTVKIVILLKYSDYNVLEMSRGYINHV